MSQHLKGLLITVLGVFILSPDALLIRLANSDTWTILFWRGLLFALGITIIVFLSYRSTTIRQFANIGKRGILLGFLFGWSTIFFVTAIQYTSIANALVIISISPVFSALLSWVFLKEKTNLRTWITMFIIIAATAAIMFDSFKHGGFWGDMAALATALLLAINFTLTRQAKKINMVPAMAIAGLTTSAIAAIMIALTASPLLLEAPAVPYLLLMGLVVTLAFSLITLGPRYMPAAEVGMIMPLETVFGAYLAWIFLSEAPTMHVIIGGGVIMITLMIHACFMVRGSS
ncbi:MAG: DMT family transporter [Cocleimonas sp.]|nr:DMT family transporter [Cocleimonas sp.]